MLIECKKCGAPLDVKGTERVTRCKYCGATTKLRETKTIAAQTPTGWSPPREWIPPQHVKASSSHPLRYRRRRAPAGCSLVGCIPLLAVLTGVGISLYASGQLERLPFVGKVARWDGHETLECAVNERLVIEGKEADVTNGPVVQATGPNCHVLIRGSRLRGGEVVRGGINTEITVEDSTLEAAYDGIAGRGPNMVVRVTGQSTIVAGGDAIGGGDNLEVEVHGATVRGGRAAIRGGYNTVVSLTQAHVEGMVHAIEATGNAEVRAVGSQIIGGTELGRNSEIEQR